MSTKIEVLYRKLDSYLMQFRKRTSVIFVNDTKHAEILRNKFPDIPVVIVNLNSLFKKHDLPKTPYVFFYDELNQYINPGEEK